LKCGLKIYIQKKTPEDGGRMFPRDIGSHLKDYTNNPEDQNRNRIMKLDNN
jgi:hypothetical protein